MNCQYCEEPLDESREGYDECAKCEAACEAAMAEALAEYPAHKAQVAQEEEQEECPHDEHDHGICLDCGKDIFDDLVGRADFLMDCAKDA